MFTDGADIEGTSPLTSISRMLELGTSTTSNLLGGTPTTTTKPNSYAQRINAEDAVSHSLECERWKGEGKAEERENKNQHETYSSIIHPLIFDNKRLGLEHTFKKCQFKGTQ